MGFTQALDNEILDVLLSQVAMTLNTNPVYIGLSTTLPTNLGANFTEPSGNGYARASVANDATEWPAAVAGVKSNANLQTFPPATGAWGTLGWFGLFDAPTGGNLILWGALAATKTPASGDTLKFPPTTLVVTQA